MSTPDEIMRSIRKTKVLKTAPRTTASIDQPKRPPSVYPPSMSLPGPAQAQPQPEKPPYDDSINRNKPPNMYLEVMRRHNAAKASARHTPAPQTDDEK